MSLNHLFNDSPIDAKFESVDAKSITVTTLIATNIVNPTFSDALLSVGGAVVQNNIPSYADTTGLLVQDSGVNSSDIFLRTGVVPMIGDLDMNSNSVSNVVNLNNDAVSSYIKTPSLQDLDMKANSLLNVTNLNGNAVSSYINTPSSQDLDMNTHALSNVTNINGVAVSNYFTNPATVNLNMNAHEINNVSAVRFNNTNVTLGSSSTIGSGTTNNVNIGNATTIGFGADSNIVMGNQASVNTTSQGNVIIGLVASSTLGGANVIIGQQAIARGNAVAIGREAVAGNLSTVVGYRSSSGINTDTIIVGHDNVSSGGASGDIFGINRTNNQPNSLLLGNGSYVNIRANNTCDLGTVAVPFNSVFANGNLVSAGSSKSVDNIVSTASTGVSGNLVTFSGGKVVQDSTVPLASLATSSNVILRNGSQAFTGNQSLGGFNLTNAGIITTNTATVNVGNANTTSSVGDIYVGSNNTAGGSGGGISVIYGNTNNMSGTTNGQSIVYGNNNSDSNAAGGSFIYGFGNTNGTGQRNVLIGRNNVVPNGVNDAYVIGFAQTNSMSGSLLVGGNTTNIRPNNTDICNLGVLTTNQFNNTFTNKVDTSGALSIASISATSLALGRAGILSTINGDCAINSQAFGAWYSTVSFSNGFAAGVNRVVNPALTTAGSLSQFTNALGVLTYTGARTRLFKVEYNISYLIPAVTGNMIFFNSINPATPPVLGTVQTRIFNQSSVSNNGTRVCLHFSDNITMATNDTIQLCAQLQNLNVAVTFDFIMCNIVGALN